MHKTLRNLSEYAGRRIAITFQCVVLLTICNATIIPPEALAQSKGEKSSLCTQDNAFDMIKQQVDLTKTFNDGTRRIAVLIRAADLLWPYQQDKARAIFTEAFELAIENEKENEEKGPRSLILILQTSDQRYVVIRAVAKRDSAWAKDLTRQVLKTDTPDGDASPTKDLIKDVVTAEKLLDSANQLISTDINAAFDLARASLNYPGSSALTRFLYRLAEINQQAADQFYIQVLAVYAKKPMREFLYLQAYPFALPDSLNTPFFASYVVPANFVTNRSLQRQFVQVMLGRAQQALEVSLDAADTYRNPSGTLMPGKVHLLQALMDVEPQVSRAFPDLLAPLTQAREKILVSLSVETQKLLLQPGREISTATEKTFDEAIESAQKVPDLNRRDQLIAWEILSTASDQQSLASVIEAIDKISDSNLRVALRELIYFRRARAAIKDKQFEDAEKLASEVEGLEQRAYLHTEIAKGLLNKNETQSRAREVLDEAISEAKKAGTTIFAARTLLTASNLYAKIDLGRSISVLAEAVNCINRLESPDFHSNDQSLTKAIPMRSKAGGEYRLTFQMPGIEPETALREMGKLDFDTALSQSSALTDKFHRSMSTLALAELCLQLSQLQSTKKPKWKA
jgi:tetratricopeptide (TPR) repeat protein